MRRLPFLASILRLVLLAICCALPAAPGFAQTRVSIASLITSPVYLSLWLADEQGFFARQGLDARIVILESAYSHIGSEHRFGVVGVPAALVGTGQGQDLKVLMPLDVPQVTALFIARPEIRSPADLRGKRIGVTSLGTGAWINANLSLDHLGMDAVRDGISFVVLGGGSATLAQAVEDGRADAATMDPGQAAPLLGRGFTLILDMAQARIDGVQSGLMVDAAYLRERPDVAEKMVAAMLEGLAFGLAPQNEETVKKVLAARMNLSSPAAIDSGYRSFLARANRKPYLSMDHMRTMQRIIGVTDPAVLKLDVEALVDDRFVRKLDESGAIDRLYREYGVR
jgi:NitT/TauT family transport system substrate-binding protein